MADDVKVVRQTTETIFDDNGKPLEQVRVEFKVGDNGPFYKRFPVDGFNGLQVRDALETFAREVRTLKGPAV